MTRPGAPRELELQIDERRIAYTSASQRARVITESWAEAHLYCPNCGHHPLNRYEANRPVADFFCSGCADEFELKSASRPFGRTLVNGAYAKKMERLASDTSPNLVLLHYDRVRMRVVNLTCVPSRFFVQSIIEARKPLAETARRSGWVGSNILLHLVPRIGLIDIVRCEEVMRKPTVLESWRRSAFLDRDQPAGRGWLVDVMICVEQIEAETFSLADVYAFGERLQRLYPENRNVRAKIRQQLQLLRDNGYLEFLGNGKYRKRA